MLLGKDGEHGTECRKLPCRPLAHRLFRQEVDIGLASRGFHRIPEQINLHQHLVRVEYQKGDRENDATDKNDATEKKYCRQGYLPLLLVFGSAPRTVSD